MKKHSGFVGIIGEPNVGKSTLLNRLIGEKLSAVSSKPQTTRQTIRGIMTRQEGQAIFLDTPGFHQPKDKIGGWMMDEIKKTLHNVELIYLMVRPKQLGKYEQQMIHLLEACSVPVFLLINKMDLVKKTGALPVIEEYQSHYPFKEYIPISAETGEHVSLLIEETFKYLPEAELYFPEDQISDQHERMIVAELIREKLYHHTHEEVPYSTTVEINKFQARNDKLIDIEATVIVERDSQKAIVIGKKGANMKLIGTEARKDIEALLGKKVFLKLWARTELDWKSSNHKLKEYGYR